MFSLPKLAMVGLLLPIVACTTVSKTPYAHEDGWRHATVDTIVSASALPATLPVNARCVPNPSSAQWALVSYHRWGNAARFGKSFAGIPLGINLAVGDHVLINLNDCDKPLLKQST